MTSSARPPARDLVDRVIVITGSSSGIGRATAEALAARGANLVLANRSEERTAPVLTAIRDAGGRATFHALDLTSLRDTQASAESLRNAHPHIDVLINNAGVGGQRGTTRDGFELTFGTNHLGHFVFTSTLLPSLRTAPSARIVNVSSIMHTRVKHVDWDLVRGTTRSRTGLPEYAFSKLCNVWFTKELARREAAAGSHVTSFAVHPGGVASNIWRELPRPIAAILKLFLLTNEQGARTSIACATEPGLERASGGYFYASKERRGSSLSRDEALARELWTRSERWAEDALGQSN